jgi:acyl-CoA reductase-like NAD-dependent aldehyde dehydrogenase
MTWKEPIGVCAQIIPWNFPLLMAAWKLAPALATGCTVVLKPSEKTLMTALEMGEIFNAAGLPEGVVNIVPGLGSAGSYLAGHADVDKVAFTGSTSTAMKIKKTMGLRPFTAELGGKSPMIIFEDADFDTAVMSAWNGTMFNHGQCCNASTRIFVHEKMYDRVLAALVELAKQRKLGDPFGEVDQGPLIDKIQFDKVMAYIQSARDSGVKIAAGGNRWGDKGYFTQPTILDQVDETHKCSQEEIFGPVMALQKFNNEDDVIARANNTNYGLGAGIITQNTDTVNRVSRRLRAGTVWVNTYHIFDNNTPFGGYKDSGVGREKGAEALDNYLINKTVVQTLKGDSGWYR